MRTKVLLALGAGLIAGAALAQDVEVKLSGQVNRAIMHADDGTADEWFNVDNDNSSTRIRLNAEGTVSPSLKAGILWEVEYQSNPSNLVTFAAREAPSPDFDERHMDIYLRGGWGTLRLGQGDGAANGASEVDLSGTTVAHYSDTTAIGGAFEHRSGGALSGASITATIANQDFESRYDRLLYQTPVMSGFMIEASWGNKATDIVELALRYSAKIGSAGQLAAALGYSSEDAAPGGVDDEIIGGSVSWLHPSGLNLTYAHTSRDLPGRDGKFDYVKVGYKFDKHALSIDFGMGQDQAMSGDEAKMYGIGYVFTPIAWAEVFALYKVHSLERTDVSLDDISFAMIGTRIKF